MTTPPAPPPPAPPAPPPAAPPTPPAAPPAPPEQPGPVPYDRFKEVNDAKTKLEQQLAERTRLDQEAEEKRLKESNDWKTLAEKREQELNTERAERLRLQVATKKQLPPELAARLVGATEAELEADADKLLAAIKPAEGPGVPRGGSGRPGKIDLSKMTPAQIRQANRK